jgi:hypothetical protein
MKFDELIKRLLEDYNYDFTSGKYATGTAYAGGPNTPLNVTMPFQGMGGANQPIGRGLFPQKGIDYKTKKKKKTKNKTLKFENYSFLKEDPDYVDIDTDELRLNIEYDSGNVYGFGFVNTDIVFDNHKPLEELKEEHGKLIIKENETHGQLKKIWIDSLNNGVIKTLDKSGQIRNFDLSNNEDKIELKFTPFIREINGRIILSPAGRVWKNVTNQATGKPITFISFWHFRNPNKNISQNPSSFGDYVRTKYESLEIMPEHVIKILNYLQIPKSDWFDVYLEFMEDDIEGSRHPRTTAIEFINSKSNKTQQPEPEVESELTDEKKKRMEELESKMKRGAHGNVLNPNFGSPYQAKKAERAGLPSYAEYNARRNPYGESVNSHKR